MKTTILSFLALVVISCSESDTSGSKSKSDTRTGKEVLSIREKERLVWRYFQRVEKEVGGDLGVSEDTLEERIQQLIDEGHVVSPIVYFNTKDGWQMKAVDYKSYKAYREGHPIVGVRPLVPQHDSASYDALRDDLLEALSAEGVHGANGSVP